MKQASLYICYYNVTEPLVRTQVIAYLRELARRGIEIHLLTFERERHSTAKQEQIRAELMESGIIWHSLRYHQRPSLPATLYDIAVGTLAALRICRKHKIGLVHARSHVPGAMALLVKRLLGCRFLFDMRGLMAEEYVDAGSWKEGELKFNLTKRMERAFFRRADALVMLTNRIKRELVETEPALSGRVDDIQVIPCCVDAERFSPDRQARQEYRRERGWEGRYVITYVGKLGTWYLPEEMAQFFAVANRRDGRFFFQVLTQSDPSQMQKALEKTGVHTSDYDIRFSPPEELPSILTASDAGLSFILPSYSKRASSPTKIAEYLVSGLPVVANADIGDCDEMLENHHLGVIVRSLSDDAYENAVRDLLVRLEDETISSRCEEFVEHELSLAKVGGPRYAAIYEKVLGPCTTAQTQHPILLSPEIKLMSESAIFVDSSPRVNEKKICNQ